MIPFFDRYTLHTVKKSDFESFKRIVVMMNSELHLTADGFKEIVSIAYSMNANGSRRRINRGNSRDFEILRDYTPEVIRADAARSDQDIVRSA